MEDKAEALLEKAKVTGKNLADKADEIADDLTDKFKGKGKDDVTEVPPEEPKA